MQPKVIALVVTLLCTGQALLQPRQPGIISSLEPESTIGSVPDLSTAQPFPESAQTKYGVGNAPFYVNRKAYTYSAERAIRDDLALEIETESDALGISPNDFAELVAILGEYRDQEKKDWTNYITLGCASWLRGLDVDEEYARSALALLDDNDDRRAALVDGVLMDVQVAFGEDVLELLRLRIEERGETVDYTRIDLVKYIDASLSRLI